MSNYRSHSRYQPSSINGFAALANHQPIDRSSYAATGVAPLSRFTKRSRSPTEDSKYYLRSKVGGRPMHWSGSRAIVNFGGEDSSRTSVFDNVVHEEQESDYEDAVQEMHEESEESVAEKEQTKGERKCENQPLLEEEVIEDHLSETMKRHTEGSLHNNGTSMQKEVPCQEHRGCHTNNERIGADEILKRLEVILGNEADYRSFLEQRGSLAQSLLDLLQSLSDHPEVNVRLRSKLVIAMKCLSKKSNLYPNCLSLNKVERLGEYAVTAGGFGDIWKGLIGSRVRCLKVALKVYDRGDSKRQMLLKNFQKEVILWRRLDHPNVLPFLGLYSLDESKQRLSPWMDNGNVVQYLHGSSGASADRITLVHDIAPGLVYLHWMKVFHDDLKGTNTLVGTVEIYQWVSPYTVTLHIQRIASPNYAGQHLESVRSHIIVIGNTMSQSTSNLLRAIIRFFYYQQFDHQQPDA